LVKFTSADIVKDVSVVSMMFMLKTLGCSFESMASPEEPLPPWEMAVAHMLSYLLYLRRTHSRRTDNLFRDFVNKRFVSPTFDRHLAFRGNFPDGERAQRGLGFDVDQSFDA
jgi:hypothetical protein